MWAFCKAVLACARRNSGLSVRLCWRAVHVGVLSVCPFLDWVFGEAVSAGSLAGFL